MFQHGQHPVFSTQAVIHREVTPQLPECHHKYLILQLSSQDWPPITDFGNWEESDVWNVCRVWIWSSSLTMTPQSSKINWLALGALLVVIQPPNSWQQWKSVLHTVISKLPCLQLPTIYVHLLWNILFLSSKKTVIFHGNMMLFKFHKFF